MADIAASDVTVVVERRAIEGKSRRNRVKITVGDGALTYPANGIPLPAASAFGMKVRLDYLTIFDEDDGTGYMWKYDKENKKLRCYFTTGGATASPASGTANPQVTTGAATASAVNATTPALTPGVAKEFASTSTTPVASTLYAEAVGW